MNTPITVEYGGVVIVYVERDNRWMCEIRGRERSFDTLVKAKEAIDKPEPKEKTFNRTPAWYKGYGIGCEPCEVTSVAEAPSWRGSGSTCYWVSRNGGRSKEFSSSLFAKSPENDSKVKELDALKAQIESLNKQALKVAESLTPFKP